MPTPPDCDDIPIRYGVSPCTERILAGLRVNPCYYEVHGAAVPGMRRQLKPDVVLFGENVPRDRYQQAHAALGDADALLVAGSSLMVYSGFRFVRLAHEAGLPIAIVNRGLTRGDDLAELKIAEDVGSALTDALRSEFH